MKPKEDLTIFDKDEALKEMKAAEDLKYKILTIIEININTVNLKTN